MNNIDNDRSSNNEIQILKWLNFANSCDDPIEKLNVFNKLLQVLITQSPDLLQKFLCDILNFITDIRLEVNANLIDFIEETYKINRSLLPGIILNLHTFLDGPDVQVQKKIIQIFTTLYPKILTWICGQQNDANNEIEETWNVVNVAKYKIANMIDNDNNDISASCIQFLECVIFSQTKTEQAIKNGHSEVLSKKALEEEAHEIFTALVKLINSENTFICIQVLSNIAKNRQEFMGKIIKVFELLMITSIKMQDNAIKKNLKSVLISLLNHDGSATYTKDIQDMLFVMGSTLEELQSITEKDSILRMSKRKIENDCDLERKSKRTKVDVPAANKTLNVLDSNSDIVHMNTRSKINQMTKPLNDNIKNQLYLNSMKNLLNIPETKKVIQTFGSSGNESVRSMMLTCLLADLEKNLDAALFLLLKEYNIMKGFVKLPGHRDNYVSLFTALINSCSESSTFSSILMNAPLVTEEALIRLNVKCQEQDHFNWALDLLHDLVIYRKDPENRFINALLSHTISELKDVQNHAISHIISLYQNGKFKYEIENYAKLHLNLLCLPKPSNEESINDVIAINLSLFIALLHRNHSLIHDLVPIYIQSNVEMKRKLLKLIEDPIRLMGMDSLELLKLVENCPVGSEILITHITRILIDKKQPSAELIQSIKSAYSTKVTDVRFLVPILNSLTKKEVMDALPKLIKLNPNVVKTILLNLLSVNGGKSPLTPVELLVALHVLDSSQVDHKTAIKATSICFEQKQIFSKEVLTVVLNRLIDQTTLPTLLMRTVLQTLALYPSLSGIVISILEKLISKEVWKHKPLWEGFIKCCQHTVPQSFSVLLKLPELQLSEVLSTYPDLHKSFKQYFMNLKDDVPKCIPSTVKELILN